ncbi:NF038143 family protein [Desulfonatronospira sp.]|uniref:NF038143 family protein n=1 Tax=Desulfonatronospira sp. TaxID=1962951 RepID=UPI0025BC5CD3|nr:NF038143 family protein [Desulfonatronospira sp.]
MDQDFEQRFTAIFKREEQFAHTLATSVIQKPKLTVWMFLVPILFIYHANHIKRYKNNLANFQQGFTRTKMHALNLAREELVRGERKQQREMDLFADYDVDGPNVAEVRKRQLEEIQLLHKHYRNLLKASGRDYPELVRSAYKTKQEFKKFLKKLGEVEKEVNKAALKAFHDTEESRKVVSDMELHASVLRKEEAERIFNV